MDKAAKFVEANWVTGSSEVYSSLVQRAARIDKLAVTIASARGEYRSYLEGEMFFLSQVDHDECNALGNKNLMGVFREYTRK